VIVADVVATILCARLDLVVSRKIGAPFNPEYAIGAVMPDGTCFLNASAAETLQVPEQYIATQVKEQMGEIDRRLLWYRGRKDYDSELEGKFVILVDDGIATGSTIYAAAQWVKAQKSGQLIIAIPVVPKEAIEKLSEVADMIVSVETPVSFEAVGEFYQDFSQVTDGEVIAIMRRYGYKSLDFKDEGAAA
jgi:putative phosphoribosyl transferase